MNNSGDFIWYFPHHFFLFTFWYFFIFIYLCLFCDSFSFVYVFAWDFVNKVKREIFMQVSNNTLLGRFFRMHKKFVKKYKLGYVSYCFYLTSMLQLLYFIVMFILYLFSLLNSHLQFMDYWFWYAFISNYFFYGLLLISVYIYMFDISGITRRNLEVFSSYQVNLLTLATINFWVSVPWGLLYYYFFLSSSDPDNIIVFLVLRYWNFLDLPLFSNAYVYLGLCLLFMFLVWFIYWYLYKSKKK